VIDDLVVDALASARLTRLVTTDTFPPAKAARKAVVARAGSGSSLAELVECAWCAGFWVTAGCRLARRVAPRQWAPVAEVFAAAMVASWFVGKSREEGDPQDIASPLGRLADAAEKMAPVAVGVDETTWGPAPGKLASMGRHPTGIRPVRKKGER
jgi:hypothetical protein